MAYNWKLSTCFVFLVGGSFQSKDVELEATDVLWTVHGEPEFSKLAILFLQSPIFLFFGYAEFDDMRSGKCSWTQLRAYVWK